MAVNLNTNKIIDQVSELHDDISDTIFSITQDKLRFEHKRVHPHEEKDTLPDDTKIEKVTPLDLVQSNDDNHSSQEEDKAIKGYM
ncbi:hypothetical protein C1645_833355 [Glomus cerebriforme]|uniref:Uncharacterized protein n=1 Tax=Glomus cerebriforme TaxID=658196 RepID=A0A397SM78_9GLOM|nr:hypothetical protein C1645_833355 [Glomus cerebriforme]